MKTRTFTAEFRSKVWIKRGELSLYIAIKCVLFIGAVALPLLFAKVLDSIVVDKNHLSFMLFSALFIGSSAMCSSLKYASDVLNTKLDTGLVFLSSQAVIQKFFRLSLHSLAKIEGAYISTRIINDAMSVVSFTINNLLESIFGLLQCMAIIMILARLSVPLFITICIMLPLCAIAFSIFRKRTRELAARTKEVAAKYSASNQKQCASYLFIKLNGLLDVSLGFVKRYYLEALDGFLAYRKNGSVMDLVVALIQLSATGFLIVYGGGQVLSERLSLGQFTAINSYFISLVTVTGGIIVAGRQIVHTRESIRRMDEILANPMETREVDGAFSAAGHGILGDAGSVSRISISQLKINVEPANTISFHDFIFTKGKICCITGENGTGKSTLLKAICGGYLDYTGEILYDRTNIKHMDMNECRKHHIAFLPQSPTLFFENADEILSLGGTVSNTDATIRCLSLLLKTNDPKGFIEERLRNNGSSVESRFSGGERQKIAFACAWAKNSEILLVDEPTSAMDEEGKVLIAEMLKEASVIKIVVCVTHDPSLLERADEIIALKRGT